MARSIIGSLVYGRRVDWEVESWVDSNVSIPRGDGGKSRHSKNLLARTGEQWRQVPRLSAAAGIRGRGNMKSTTLYLITIRLM